MSTIAALGFRTHTGWTAAVAVGARWEILDRRRIACEPTATRFIYHKAAEMPLKEAQSLIEVARAEVLSAAEREIASMLTAISQNGVRISTAGVPGGNITLPDSLAEILAAHSRIHAAEGSFYRDALAEACVRLGLRVERMPERDLWRGAVAALGSSEEDVRAKLTLVGKSLGPPWGEDQKLATIAAFCALAPPRPRKP